MEYQTMTMDNDGADMARNVVVHDDEEYETLMPKQRSPARCPAEEVVGDLDDDEDVGDFKERYECK